MSKKIKKYIPLLILVIIFSGISYIIGVYSFYYKIFPFNPAKKIKIETNKISSSLYDLNVNLFNLPINGKYGGIEKIKNNILFVSGDGKALILDEKNLKFNEINTFDLKINKKEFIKNYEKDFGKLRLQRRFGVKDIYINNFQGETILFLSSIFYNIEKDCYNLSLFKSTISSKINLKFNGIKKVFETKKCLVIENNLPSSTSYKLSKNFAPTSASGRIEKINEDSILLTVGDFLYDGVNSENLVQDKKNDYGKILKINIKDYSYKIFSIGHRNPQGITLIDQNNIFASEHGPAGGDEINKIEENNNYGWPYKTYGTDYGKKNWPIKNKKKHSLENYVEPIISWTPSIAVSEIVFYDSNYFEKWKNSLLVSTLKDKSLYRIIMSKKFDKVLNIEKIEIGYRMRDIIIDEKGRIIILTDTKDNNQIPKILILSK